MMLQQDAVTLQGLPSCLPRIRITVMAATAPLFALPRGERLSVELASGSQAIEEAQALRYRIFAVELGARLKSQAAQLDCDEFDACCQHLLVRETRTARVVGCTRLLDDTQARALGGYYAETEFDLGSIRRLTGRLLEVGRTCIAPEYRQGAAIAVLWSGLASYVQMHQVDYLFGCASVPLGEGDAQAAAIMNRLRRQALTGEELRVTPRQPLRIPMGLGPESDAPLPPLLKTYVRLGARACGEPYRDADFHMADVLMLLNVREMNPSYSRHFIHRAAVRHGRQCGQSPAP